MTKPNVLLIGAGGVGAIVAYTLDRNGKSDLSIVVRRDYDKVSQTGYDIDSIDYGHVKGWKPKQIYHSVEAASSGVPYDFVIVSTKNLPDVIKMEDVVEPVITPGVTTIVLIQNGFDNGRPYIAKYPENVCLSGVSHIGSHNHNGVIDQSQPDKCVISYFENTNLALDLQKEKAEQFVDLYSNDINDVSYFADVKWYRYRKLVYNATLNTVCALVDLDTGRLQMSGTLESVSIPAMREVIKVAKSDGVELPKDIINEIVHSDDGGYFEPSMRVDVRKGNPIELETILGSLLRVAREKNVDTPVLDLVYKLLEAVQFRLKEGKGIITVPEDRPEDDKHYA